MKNNFINKKKNKWYAINIYSGYEKYVKYTLIKKMKKKNLQNYFQKIIIPTQKKISLINNYISSEQQMPGYLLIKCYLTEETWKIITSVPKIIGFIGNTKNPIYLNKKDIKNIYLLMQQNTKIFLPTLQLGNFVKIKYGPFSNVSGTINKINTDKKTLQILVSFLGRNTPIEVSFSNIDKIL